MKFAVVFVVALAVLSAVSEARRHLYYGMDTNRKGRDDIFKWFDQRNNHFSKDDVSTWKQRYIVNETYWRGNGYPIFVMLGGEGPLGEAELAGHFILNEKADKYGALMVSVEHRFYGQSIPGDGTLSTSNLRLLSADQALADYAVFISYIKSQFNAADSKVVTFGGSYSGSLSAWMRQKYPNLVDIGYASSAPVFAKLDFPEYFQVVTESVGPTCAARLTEAYQKIESLLNTNPTKVLSDFKACSTPVSQLDMTTFVESLSDSVAGVVQYSGDNNGLGRAWNVTKMCSIIGTTGDAYDSYANFVSQYLASQGEKCNDANYDDEVKELQNTDPNAPGAAGRSWTYQTCVEYGYYQTVESSTVPFSKLINLDYFLGMCKDVYGIDKDHPAISVDYTNSYYGGRDVRSNKIVFLNGSVDPWHALGLISDTPKPEDMPVFYIKGTAHCADLYGSSPNDLDSLTNARIQAWKYVDKWLNEK